MSLHCLNYATPKKPFDVVFIDELMPGCNGIELMRTISRANDIEAAKLILMTNQAHAESFLDRFVEIDAFIRKTDFCSRHYLIVFQLS